MGWRTPALRVCMVHQCQLFRAQTTCYQDSRACAKPKELQTNTVVYVRTHGALALYTSNGHVAYYSMMFVSGSCLDQPQCTECPLAYEVNLHAEFLVSRSKQHIISNEPVFTWYDTSSINDDATSKEARDDEGKF